MDLLTDPARCQVVLVTLPEATPINEVLETTTTLVDRVGVRLGPIVVNEVDTRTEVPDPSTVTIGRDGDARAARAAAVFRRARRTMQDGEIARLAAAIGQPHIELVSLPVAGLDADDIATLAASLTRADEHA
jgi:hypothetical protein